MNASSYIILTFVSAVAMTLLGSMLLGIRIRHSKEMAKLHVARVMLSISYFVLAVPAYLEYFCHTETDTRVIATFTLATAAFQSLLFTATLLTLILPHYVTRRRTLCQAGAVTAAVAIFLPLALCSRNPFPVLCTGLAAYGCQLVYYTRLFRQKYNESLRKLETYYDEDEHARLRWVKIGFYAALIVGAAAAVSTYLPPLFYNVFMVVYIVFYTWFVVRFYNYVADAGFYLSAVTATTKEPDSIGEEPEGRDIPEETPAAPTRLQEKELRFQQALDVWVASKGYIKKDIGTAEIAAELGTDLPFLRHYFHTYLPPDFRAWRMELRIREAQRIMEAEPDLPISQVGEKVGISDRSNFRCQFIKITGILPADYKAKLKENK